MKNEIISISKGQFEQIKSQFNPAETFLVEIDGKEIQSKGQLWDVMEEKYDLHISSGTWGKNWDAFNDLMCDLSWIPQQKHILAIYAHNELFKNDKSNKSTFMACLKEDILPFWEKDVLSCVLEGKTKEFTVYLVD